jgi:hypothetical protein
MRIRQVSIWRHWPLPAYPACPLRPACLPRPCLPDAPGLIRGAPHYATRDRLQVSGLYISYPVAHAGINLNRYFIYLYRSTIKIMFFAFYFICQPQYQKINQLWAYIMYIYYNSTAMNVNKRFSYQPIIYNNFHY